MFILSNLSLDLSPLAQQSGGTPGWVWLLVFLLVVVLIWILLTVATKQSPADMAVHHGEGDEELVEESEAQVEEPAEPQISAEEPESQEAEVEEEQLTADEPVEEAPPPEPDDLKRLEGIGPKIQSLLQDAGIITFAQLAETDVDHLDEILDAAGLTFSDANTWPEQAQLAAQGDWDGLEKMQADLKGGRRA